MFLKSYRYYKNLLDKRIDNGTFIVIVISFLIACVWFLINDTDASLYVKSSVLDYSNTGTINIDWKEYEIRLKNK